jgi:hypothetical protein
MGSEGVEGGTWDEGVGVGEERCWCCFIGWCGWGGGVMEGH